jgi:hypothetical protein
MDAGAAPAAPAPPTAALITSAHRRRLREIWRSAGWPCRDSIELDLLAAGLLERRFDGDGRETLSVSDAGVTLLAATLAHNRGVLGAHEALVARVAEEMRRAGRIVWRSLALRAPLPPDPVAAGGGGATAGAAGEAEAVPPRSRWVIARPDVYSIRHTTLEDQVEPVVHEIKVRRADLLADLRRPDKRAAYRAVASQCWYVLAEGIGTAGDVPEECGVLLARAAGLELVRPAPRRPMRIPFALWMSLARASADGVPEEQAQAPLGPVDG